MSARTKSLWITVKMNLTGYKATLPKSTPPLILFTPEPCRRSRADLGTLRQVSTGLETHDRMDNTN